jgi:hypothetical protein
VSVQPDCARRIKNAEQDFDMKLSRGLVLAYASPITVSGWRRPAAACRRWNADARFRVSKFKWQSLDKIEESIRRMKYETTLSYVWSYDQRYTLQRLEPGLYVFGSFEEAPSLRFFLDLELATYWHLRLENTYQLAALDLPTAWKASMDYTF